MIYAKIRSGLTGAVLFTAFLSSSVVAEIVDYHITDVTSNSFTVIFSSTELIIAPGIKVYQDSEGLVELSPEFDIISSQQQHQNGLSAIRLHSLASTNTYYFNLTEDISSSPYFPASSIPSVTTFAMPSVTSTGELITNDLIKLDVYRPDQIASLEGAVVLLSLPSISLYPVSSFIGVNDFAYVDANNLLKGDASIHLVEEGQNIEITVLRGLLCSGAVDHLQVFYRKHGEDLQAGAQVNLASHCSSVDTVCDDQINVLDVQFVLNALNSTPAECRFSGDLDVVQDQQINVLDIQQILNFF